MNFPALLLLLVALSVSQGCLSFDSTDGNTDIEVSVSSLAHPIAPTGFGVGTKFNVTSGKEMPHQIFSLEDLPSRSEWEDIEMQPRSWDDARYTLIGGSLATYLLNRGLDWDPKGKPRVLITIIFSSWRVQGDDYFTHDNVSFKIIAFDRESKTDLWKCTTFISGEHLENSLSYIPLWLAAIEPHIGKTLVKDVEYTFDGLGIRAEEIRRELPHLNN